MSWSSGYRPFLPGSSALPAEQYDWKISRNKKSHSLRKHAFDPGVPERAICGKPPSEDWESVGFGSPRLHADSREPARCEACSKGIRLRQGYKTCPNCLTEKHFSQYFKQAGQPSGIGHWCKVCVTESNRKHEYSLQGKAVALMGGKCMDCGYAENEWALRVVPDLRGKSGHERARWWDAMPTRSWKVFMRKVIAAGGEGYLCKCMNCITIDRRQEYEDGGRKVTDFVVKA